jgi:hypothetical protein
MKLDVPEVEKRLRATYQAVAATTVVPAENRGIAPGPRPPRRFVTALATMVVLVAGLAATVLLRERGSERSTTTEVATAPSTTAPVPTPAGPAPTCGSALPRPLDLPEGYIGPERIASSVDGQLAIGWTSATGRIDVRWPPDPVYQQLLGHPAPTSDGQPSVSSSATAEIKQVDSGAYIRTMVFSLRNVPAECRVIQVDVMDTDPAKVEAVIARLGNRGLFVSNVPLVVSSEERSATPTVVGCSAPAGVTVPPKRGARVTGGPVFASPTDALRAFLEGDSSLIRNQYLEVRLPDGSLAYAKEQPERPGAFVTVVHVGRVGDGWSVDRWEASGC